MRWWSCVLALSLAGCDLVVGLERRDEATPDAPPDAAFQRDLCPSEYDLRPSDEASAYRIVITPRDVGAQAADCAGDLPGATHLVTIDREAEASLVVTAIEALPPNTLASERAWIGAVQPPVQDAPTAGWIGPDGEPLDPGMWSTGEPEDGTDDVENGEEQFGVFERSFRYLVDVPGNHVYGAVCECDGLPIAGTFAAALEAQD